MGTLVASRYNVSIPLKDCRVLIHNTASGAFALLTADEAEYLETPSAVAKIPTLRHQFSASGFLVEDTCDEIGNIEHCYESLRSDPSRVVLTIAPTLACNFGCDYCFQGQNKPTTFMSDETETTLVSWTTRLLRNKKHLHIAWYGGEPLLARDRIRSLSSRLLDASAERSCSYSAMMVTNGYLLSVSTAKILSDCRINTIQITIDGDTAAHDIRRPLLGGQSTFQRIVDNLVSVLNATELRISLRVNIDDRNQDGIEGLLVRLAAMKLDRKQLSVYFAPVEAITTKCASTAEFTLSRSRYAALETRLQHLSWTLGLSSLPYPPHMRSLCGAVKTNGYVVTPTGDLHKCWDTISFPEQKIGTIFDSLEAVSTTDLAQRWSSWTPTEHPVCRDCLLLPVCAGSCAHKFVNREHLAGETVGLPCPPWKYNLKERLVRWAVSRGVLAADDVDNCHLTSNSSRATEVPLRKYLPIVGP